MKKLTIILCLITLLVNFISKAQDSSSDIGSIEFLSDEMSEILDEDTRIEVLADGCQFTEGPLWIENEKMLLFSDVPANTIYKWTATGGKEVYLKPAGYTGAKSRGGFMGPNGLFLSDDNKLWICQHGDRRIAEMDAAITNPKTEFKTVVGEYNGKGLNSPNDICFSSSGNFYFTDPAYGFEKGFQDPAKELSFQGVFKMDESGKLSLQIDSLLAPNGIAIFPDNNSLLLAETQGPKRGWYKYDIDKEGNLKNGKVFFKPEKSEMGGCDGLKINKAGVVFATGPGGVWVFSESGDLLGKIKVNGITAANVALTPDEKTLFITATQYVLRVRLK